MKKIKVITEDYLSRIDVEFAKEYYKANGLFENWRNYKRTNKPFVREFLLHKQDGICPICRKKIEEGNLTVLHHIDYMYSCHHSEIILHGELCSLCQIEHPILFKQCTNRMVMVHSGCHFYIHRKKIIEDKKARLLRKLTEAES